MKLKSVALAGMLQAASGLSAMARPGVISTDSNLRSGPGVQAPVVDVLPAGTPIDVGSCAGTWCRVSAGGGSGYLARSLIAFGGAPGRPVALVYDGGAGYSGDISNDYGNGPGVGVGFEDYGGYYGGDRSGFGNYRGGVR
jgi:uncharacterized protein YraI